MATKKIVFYKLSGILPVPFYFQIRDYFSNWNVLDPKSLTYGVELMQEWKQLLEFRVNDPNSAHIFKNNEAKSFGRLFSWNDFFPRIRFSTSSLKIVEERTARPRGSSWVVFSCKTHFCRSTACLRPSALGRLVALAAQGSTWVGSSRTGRNHDSHLWDLDPSLAFVDAGEYSRTSKEFLFPDNSDFTPSTIWNSV